MKSNNTAIDLSPCSFVVADDGIIHDINNIDDENSQDSATSARIREITADDSCVYPDMSPTRQYR